jgi:hypothetical protein
MLFSVLGCSVLTALFPLVATYGIGPAIAMRVVLGLCSGCLYVTLALW